MKKVVERSALSRIFSLAWRGAALLVIIYLVVVVGFHVRDEGLDYLRSPSFRENTRVYWIAMPVALLAGYVVIGLTALTSQMNRD